MGPVAGAAGRSRRGPGRRGGGSSSHDGLAVGNEADGVGVLAGSLGGRSSPSTVLERGGAGTWSRWPHFLQSDFLPASVSSTVYGVRHFGQAKRMAIADLRAGVCEPGKI